MAYREEDEPNNVHVETNLNTRLSIPTHYNEPISDFTDKFRKQHQKNFPQFGKINIIAFKVQRRGYYYNVDMMTMRNAFQGFQDNAWFMYADVKTVELVAIMHVDRNTENDGSVLVDGNTKRGLAMGPATEKTKKQKKSSKSYINQSTATASTSSRKIANEINGVPGNEMGEKIVEEVGRENVETKSVMKSTKKKKSRKTL